MVRTRLAAGVVVIVIGCVALAGWFTGRPRLTNWTGADLAIFANTAVAAVCAGLSLVMVSAGRKGRAAAAMFGGVVLLIGLLTLVEHLAGVDLGIDRLLVTPRWGQIGATAPGRMGPPASVCYTLLGLGLVGTALSERVWAARVAAWVGITVCVVALLSLTGNLFGAARLYTIPRLTGIALPTSLILMTLGLGVLTLTARVEPLRTLLDGTSAGALFRRVYPLLVLLALGLGYLRVAGEETGVFDSAFGTAVRTVVEVVMLGVLLWWAARAMGAKERELWRRKDELLRQASNLAAIVESSDDAIIGENLEGVITSWSRGAEAIFGYRPEEVIGKHVSIIIPADRRAEAELELKRLLAGERIRHFETKRLTRDGAVREILLSIYPIKDAQGRIVGISKLARDLTERERTAKDLREARRRGELATEATGVGIWEWNIKTNVVHWDAQMFRIYGIAPRADGMVGYEECALTLLPEDRAEQERILAERLRERGGGRREFRIRRVNDGEIRYIQLVETVRCDEAGEPEWVVGTNLDVTERRLAEIELAQHRQLLERKVEERTEELELAQAGLRRAERLAAMGMMAAGIGHDLSNIMAPMRWRLESLERQELSESAAEDVQEIRESLRYLARMATGLRQMAANPDTPPPLEGTSIPQWWSEVHAMIRSVVPRHISLIANIPAATSDLEGADELPKVNIHRVALTQAVFNLVQNAGEALSKREAGRIIIDASCYGLNGTSGVALKVVDDGPGMDEQVAAKCFEPYFSTRQKAVSTGMGLSLVRSVVESVGGTIELQTAPGRGTAFVIKIPAAATALGPDGVDGQAGVVKVVKAGAPSIGRGGTH